MRKKILFRFILLIIEDINDISKQIMFLKQKHKRIKEQLNDPLLQQRIKSFQIKSEICANIPKAFGYNKNHVVQLPYESNFDKKIILTKIRPIQMNQELLDYCNKEIKNLLQKCLKQKSILPWNYSAFYVQKNVEL
jgi:inorganic pyrophosphatase/exopolyphosphatase